MSGFGSCLQKLCAMGGYSDPRGQPRKGILGGLKSEYKLRPRVFGQWNPIRNVGNSQEAERGPEPLHTICYLYNTGNGASRAGACAFKFV